MTASRPSVAGETRGLRERDLHGLRPLHDPRRVGADSVGDGRLDARSDVLEQQEAPSP